jgi:DNA polymerase
MDPLYECLRFYRDLGFTDLYLPPGAAAFAALSGEVIAPADDAPQGAGGRVAGRERTPARAERPPVTGEAVRSRKAGASPPTASRGQAPPPSEYRPPANLLDGPASAGAGAATAALPVLQAIETDIGDCTRCRLHEGRSKIVFGSGNPAARLVFVGEGPGADEDAQGFPFVGRAGQLLTQMINNTAAGEGISISRNDVYICNVVKCRPPGNRTPEPDEMETCGQFLTRQLDAIRPKAICLLGATAARYLLGTKLGITKLRGNWQDWRGIPVMPTYHPSFLLRPYAQDKKREAWEDLKKVLHYVYDSA